MAKRLSAFVEALVLVISLLLALAWFIVERTSPDMVLTLLVRIVRHLLGR